ncbi:hypothetical protein [Parasitella parasitica]|uniref:HMG box domain-containing protein n=1 Tax=Parasitella parasitica TaxID=35722 RepID=A0A0B7N2Y1_9FUNG|nr:hypothetical protein [Parasitella parasitica]
MSEQNLLHYNLFKSSNNNFQFDYSIPPTATISTNHQILSNQERRDPINDFNNIYPTSSSYYLPPITTSLSFASVLHKKVLDQSEKQWRNDVSQSAIIINEKQVTMPSPVSNNFDHHSIGSRSDDQTPTHIVSPEAIREALKEEKEEAMGHSQRRPFSKFTSFQALKQRRYSTDQSLSPSSPLPPVASTYTTPSFTIPFSPPPSIKTNANYDDFDDSFSQKDDPYEAEHNVMMEEETEGSEEPETPCPPSNPPPTPLAITLEKLKRPPNAYLLFNRDMRRKLLEQSPKMTVAEISKEVGDWWKALPDAEREYYVKQASMLKEEHLKKHPDFIYTRRSKAELAEAKKASKLGRKLKSETQQKQQQQQELDSVLGNGNFTSVTTTTAATVATLAHKDTTTRKRSRKSNAAGGQRDPRGRKKKRHKHPFAPKHPMSAYLYYLASVYPQVSLNFPGSTVGPISKSISKTWHAMSPEEQLPWKQKAESDKARYAREMQVYMATNSSSSLPPPDEEGVNEEEVDEEDENGINAKAHTSNESDNDSSRHRSFLSIPLKKADEIKWTPVLLAYIIMSYAEEGKKYEADCELLDSLRNHALNQTTNSSFGLEDLTIYFNQLTFLGSRFPLNLNFHIGWFPIFQQNQKPGTQGNAPRRRDYHVADLIIAGMYSELGSLQNTASTESTRKACQYFQNAAGCLKYIQSDILPDLRAKPPLDFQLIDPLVSLMMAQAHECIWQKAVMEHMKHGTVARLAVKVADLYDSFLSNIPAQKMIPDHWSRYADAKSNYFQAVAQYQKANEAISNGRYGEEIARLRLAKTSNSTASSHIKALHPSFAAQLTALDQSIGRDLIRAEKDNDVVYMETVPEPSQLAPILRSDMVKPNIPNFISHPNYWLVLADRPNDKLFIKRPLFDKLVPLAVHQALSVFADKKDYIIKVDIVGKNQELKADKKKCLDELNLPYALDVVDALPAKLVDYAEEVQHEGGIQSLHDMLFKIQGMADKTLKLIEEGFNALEEENEQDATLSRQYGKLWNRAPSRALTHDLLTLGSQYNDTVLAAQKADRIVQAKVNNWGKAIAMLSRPATEIKAHLPSLPQDDEDYTEIHELLANIRAKLDLLETACDERNKLETEAKTLADKDDISEVLLSKANELTKGSPVVKLEPEQFSAEYDQRLKAYKRIQKEILGHVDTQNEQLQSIIDVFGQLARLAANKSALVKREKAISNLESAFTKFKEIRTNLVEGIKV